MLLLAFSQILPYQKVHAQQGGGNLYLPLVINDYNQPLPDQNDFWLSFINSQRAAAGLPPLLETSDLNNGIALHVQYMLYNPNQENVHTEYVGKPGYTEAGRIAAGQSNMVILKGATTLTEKQAIECMLSSPEHRYNLLHPDLKETSFALQCDSSNCFAGLNVLAGLPLSYNITRADFVFPGDGQRDIPTMRYPIIWAFYIPWTHATGDADEVRFVSASIIDAQGKKLSFQVKQPSQSGYDYFNQVVLTPEASFVSGMTYRVDMTVIMQGQRLSKSWSFSVR